NDSTCRRGNTSVWPGFAGRMSRNATMRSLSRTGLDGSSPARIRQKTHGSMHHHSGEPARADRETAGRSQTYPSNTRRVSLRIDTIDRAYYTVGDGDGQTKAAREASVDVGGDPRPAAQ